jgi:hypothetical protein
MRLDMDKDSRIAQTPGAIFALAEGGILEMRGQLPEALLQEFLRTGDWLTINALTYGMYGSPWWFNSHTAFSLVYSGTVLEVRVRDLFEAISIREEALTFEVILIELGKLARQVRKYLEKNPGLGSPGFYALAEVIPPEPAA